VISTDTRSERLVFGRHPGLIAVLALFVGWVVLSSLWAEVQSSVNESIFRYTLNILLVPIVYTAIRRKRHVFWMAAAFAGGAAAAAAYGLIAVPSSSGAVTSATAAGDLDRVAGTIGDPNLLAATLTVGLVMAAALAMIREFSPIARSLAVGAAVLCLLGILVTFSRGGLVGLGVAGVAAIIFGGPRYRKQIAMAVLTGALILVAWFAVLAPAGALDRVTNADGGTGRTDIWKVGWRIFEDQPLHGAGAGNFRDVSIHYLLVEPGAIARDEFIVDSPSVAHNLYLQIGAELGVVGLFLLLAGVGLSAGAAFKAARRFASQGEVGLELIARATLIALAGLLAADFFLSNEFDKRFWLLIAMGPALFHISGRGDRPAEAEPPMPDEPSA
jgi:O-antigen ligase